MFASRDYWPRPANSQLHVISFKSLQEETIFGEAIAFISLRHHLYVAVEVFEGDSPISGLRAVVEADPSPTSRPLSHLLGQLADLNNYYLEVKGRRRIIKRVVESLQAAALFQVRHRTFVTTVCDLP